MEMYPPAFLENYGRETNRPTNQPTNQAADMRGYRELTLPLSFIWMNKFSQLTGTNHFTFMQDEYISYKIYIYIYL